MLWCSVLWWNVLWWNVMSHLRVTCYFCVFGPNACDGLGDVVTDTCFWDDHHITTSFKLARAASQTRDCKSTL